ncbi:ATP-binding cassette domain-containing protein, partial [Acinetobacter baumannii]
MAATPILEARGLDTFYGQSHILRGLSFRILPGETVGLMGRNGMGKTTLIRTMMGLVRPRAGAVLLDGSDITRTRTCSISQ